MNGSVFSNPVWSQPGFGRFLQKPATGISTVAVVFPILAPQQLHDRLLNSVPTKNVTLKHWKTENKPQSKENTIKITVST